MRYLFAMLTLLFLAVASLATLAWQQAGENRYEGLAQTGFALVETLKGAALESTQTLRAAEHYLAERLITVARRADAQVAARHELARAVLADIAAEERVGQIVLLNAQHEAIASVSWPQPIETGEGPSFLPSGRKRAIVERATAARVRRAPPGPGRSSVEGVQENVFGTRERFGVVFGRREGGTLVVRASASELRALGRRFGVQPVLIRVVEVPGVESAAVLDGTGSVLAEAGVPWPRTLPEEVRAEGRAVRLDRTPSLLVARSHVIPEGMEPFQIGVALSRSWADAAVSRSRGSIVLGAGLALFVLASTVIVLWWREERTRANRARRESEHAAGARLIEMGALAGLVTHEISNPVNALRLGLGVLERIDDPAQRREILRSLSVETERVRETLEAYMALASVPAPAVTAAGPEVLRQACERVSAQAAARRVQVHVAISASAASARAEPLTLEQALANLLRNALEATPPGSDVFCSWERAESGCVRVCIDDEGPGFPADREALVRLGGRARGTGHGLGLPLARRFVTRLGGRLSLLDRPHGGGRAEVLLPEEGGVRDVCV